MFCASRGDVMHLFRRFDVPFFHFKFQFCLGGCWQDQSEPNTVTLKMEVAHSSETSEQAYFVALCNKPEHRPYVIAPVNTPSSRDTHTHTTTDKL